MFKLENLDSLEAIAERTSEDCFIVCEDECGCTGDCGSNWMRS